MDCPQCHRECGQNDKFCSECGYRLCCARTPVTELSVPGNLIVDLTVSISGAEPSRSSAVVHRVVLSDLQPVTECTATVSTAMEEEVLSNATPKTFNRKLSVPGNLIVDLKVSISGAEPKGSSAVVHRVVLSDLQPGTECTATVSKEMDDGVLSNATPKTFNRNSDQQEGPEHPISESQVHSDNHTHNDNHTHCSDHTHNDNHTHSDDYPHSGDSTQSQSLGPPDTGPPEDEAEETLIEQKEKEESQASQLESENQQKDTTAPEHIIPDTPARDSEYQEETTDNRSSLGPEPEPENPSSCLAQSQPSSADPAKSDAKSGLADADDMDGTLSKDTKDTVCTAHKQKEKTLNEQKEMDESQTSLLESENQQTDTTPAEHITPGTPAPDSEYQEETTDNRSSLGPEPAPENPSSCLAQSQPSSADPDKSDAKSGLADTATMDGTLRKDSKDTVCTAHEEMEKTLNEQKEMDESQASLLESENQQTDTTPAEHITPGTPAPDSEYQEETTDNRSSLGPEPAPENPSSCLAQSQPSSADPDKSDAKSGLADTATMDGTLRKDTKDTVCTAHEEMENEEKGKDEQEEKEEMEEEETLKEQKEKDEPQSSLLESETQQRDITPAEHSTPGTPAPELTVPGKLTADRLRLFQPSVSSFRTERWRSFISAHKAVLLDQKPGTECTATVSKEMDDGVLSNATPKTSNRNSDQQEKPEHQVSESQVHSDNHTHNDNHTHPRGQSHTHSDDHTHNDNHTHCSDHTHSDDHTHNDNHTHCSDHTHSDDSTQSQSLGPPDTGSPEDEAEETLKEQKEKDEPQSSLLESETQQRDITPAEHSTPGTPAPELTVPGKLTADRLCLFQPSVSSFRTERWRSFISAHKAVLLDQKPGTECTATVSTAMEEEVLSNATPKTFNRKHSVPGKETGDSTDVSSADLSRVRRNSIDWTRPSLDLQPRTECTATVSQNNATPKTSNRNSNRQEGPEHPVCESHTHSDNHTHSQSLGHPDTGSSDVEKKVFEDAVEYLEDEAKETEDSKEVVSVSKDKTVSKDSGYQEEATDNRFSLGPEPAPEDPSSCLAQSQPSSAGPAKSDTESGLADTDTMDGTLTKDTNDTVCTAHEEKKENLKEQKDKEGSQTSLLESENQHRDTTPAEHFTPGTPAPEPCAPGRVEATDVQSRSVTLCWERPVSMEGVSHETHITYSCEGEEPRLQICAPNTTTAVLTDLRPGMEYTFNITAVLPNGICSKTNSTCIQTRTSLDELVSDLGLEHHLKNKLTLSKVLEIDGETSSDESIQSLKSLPWCFLRRLMMVNVTARSVRCASKQDMTSQNLDSLLNTLCNPQGHSNRVNPLDLITAIFLCSDGFLQQEMVLKMSMCQFSVPLLLPKCDTQQCTLMLWAMRDIVKKYKPHSLEDQRGFVEENIVLSELPLVSFVRLRNSSLSKSHILNQILSSPQEHHETFVHRNMECGDNPKRISNGLVEISWYLPSGNRNIDIFSEPLAIANLRGDLRDFETQYAFLSFHSAAVFVFCDDFGSEYKFSESQHLKAHWFWIINSQSKSFNKDDFSRCVSELQLQTSNIIIRGPQMNDAEFIKTLRLAISGILKGNAHKMSIEQMSAVAHELGIQVDEDYIDCQKGKKKADEITERISDIPSFKEKELPLQGTAWKQLAKLEKEECRMKNAGEKNIEVYRNELADQKQKLRAQQRAHKISESMSRFISAMSGSTEERKYFLKWMRINLDNLSRKSLPLLQAEYKEQCQNSEENKELIAALDRKISSCSLGTEHFLREMGQLYESVCSIPEGPTPQIQHLPHLCAELLQEGFPLELVDGDASNIPLQWVTQVLKELHQLTQYKCKIRVVTVLGVQSTGKSTLLNTMFGVQFAVSSGRCTRGAFMLLIKVKEDFKEQLGCDYIMVIDTEGLKSAELAQLDGSCEHDNELATLVVGLSDITVINIAMENCTEMKDILQIVVHAFLRMKEVGRKPCCQFVHQNVPDLSAHDKNLRDRKHLLEQLNEMTQAAAKMEKRGNNKKFTDVMEYDPERNTWYIPGLWHGNPPMAPVNAGYSESVNLFKRSVIEHFKEHKSGKSSPHTFIEFLEWTRSLWSAVKYENFIFSFRNSLVADAYAQLCTEFNTWEWAFRKSMFSWLSQAETKVSNSGSVAAQSQPFFNVDDLMSSLKNEASVELAKGEKQIMDNLTEFYDRPEGHVHLVEKYKEEFMNSAKAIRKETEHSVINKLDATVEIRKGMFRLEKIKKNHTAAMEQMVLDLIENCRKSKDLSDQELETEFEKMWNEAVKELQFCGLEKRDIVQDIQHQLWANLEREGSSVREMLSKVGDLSECGMEPFKVKSKGMLKKIWNTFFGKEQKIKTQNMADHIIECSRKFVAEKVRTRSDYHNTYMIGLFHIIDEILERHRDLETSADFQVKLKIHICGHAAREFQKMHLDFIHANDPRHCLEQFKQQYCTDFKDLFNKRDQCQKKAEEFTYNCLAPAVKEYITKSLGPDLVDELLTGQKAIDFSTRSFFQFSVLNKLLSDDNFKEFVNYIRNYESFVQGWIFEQMVKQFSEGDGLRNIEIKHLKVMVKRLKEAVKNAEREANERVTERSKEDQNIQQFIQDICSDLQELIIPKDPLEVVLALNTAKPEDFSRCLLLIVDEMEESFTAEFQGGGDVRARLTSLPFQPQKELFNRVFGCGRQCPFCMTPCEAGGKNHTEHFASIHRPEGTGSYRYTVSGKLSVVVCSSCVVSEGKFQSSKTEGKYHPYKDYRSIYPDWLIQPDSSIQASDYWKYVFNKFNEQFAKVYKAEPADIPPLWGDITQDQAMKNLKETFQMKAGD
ncbi:interferon-induced very large GTPase 1-like [Anguilla rostrata]|uniref:interferon-induced very large GTPase 1-like n=1 Tax=Anguilla rostrata TaxID=7938 RepID=UPI0030CCC7DC